jgi:peptide/nickel transport system permease protein
MSDTNAESKEKDSLVTEAAAASVAPSAFRVIWREIYHDKMALVALFVFVTIIAGIFLLSLTIDQKDATFIDFNYRNAPPSAQFILGNDNGGRSIADLLVLGARNSILVGFSVTLIAGFVGICVGLISGFYGGHIDNAVMRVIDTWNMLPTLMIIIVIVTIMPDYQTYHFVLVMSAFSWTGTARLIRAMALQQRNLDYVSASKTLGTRNPVIMIREVLPNLVSIITVNMTLSLAGNMGIETGLTFLGFGLPFNTPSLGWLVSLARNPFTLQNRMFQWLPAALLIFILMFCIYCVGQALNRAADARQRRI